MSSIVEFVLTDLGKNHIIAELEFHGHMKWRVWPVISGQALDLQNINFSRYKKGNILPYNIFSFWNSKWLMPSQGSLWIWYELVDCGRPLMFSKEIFVVLNILI